MSFTNVMRVGLLLVLGLVSAAHADSYLLVPQDRVVVRAMRWDPTSTTYLRWDGISGEYTVAQDGTLAVPLIGQIEAQGKNTGDLSRMLEIRLRRQTGMAEPPQIALEVIGHLPVYVLGDVAGPGAYPFRPGLTAQQALALAGGPLRPPVQFNNGTDLQPLRLGGEIRLLNEQIEDLQQEKRRLVADLDAVSSQGAAGSAQVPSGLEGEILIAAQNARSGQEESIRELKSVLTEKIASLAAQLELLEQRIALTKKDLDNVTSLKEKGLTVNTRVTALTNALNNLEAERLNLDIAQLTARQQLNRAERDGLALLDTARSNALVRLNTVEQELTTLQTRLATARLLHSEVVAAGLTTDTEPSGEAVIRYAVTRGDDAVTTQIDATTKLQPGDTLDVTREVVLEPLSGQTAGN